MYLFLHIFVSYSNWCLQFSLWEDGFSVIQLVKERQNLVAGEIFWNILVGYYHFHLWLLLHSSIWVAQRYNWDCHYKSNSSPSYHLNVSYVTHFDAWIVFFGTCWYLLIEDSTMFFQNVFVLPQLLCWSKECMSLLSLKCFVAPYIVGHFNPSQMCCFIMLIIISYIRILWYLDSTVCSLTWLTVKSGFLRIEGRNKLAQGWTSTNFRDSSCKNSLST